MNVQSTYLWVDVGAAAPLLHLWKPKRWLRLQGSGFGGCGCGV